MVVAKHIYQGWVAGKSSLKMLRVHAVNIMLTRYLSYDPYPTNRLAGRTALASTYRPSQIIDRSGLYAAEYYPSQVADRSRVYVRGRGPTPFY